MQKSCIATSPNDIEYIFIGGWIIMIIQIGFSTFMSIGHAYLHKKTKSDAAADIAWHPSCVSSLSFPEWDTCYACALGHA